MCALLSSIKFFNHPLDCVCFCLFTRWSLDRVGSSFCHSLNVLGSFNMNTHRYDMVFFKLFFQHLKHCLVSTSNRAICTSCNSISPQDMYLGKCSLHSKSATLCRKCRGENPQAEMTNKAWRLMKRSVTLSIFSAIFLATR